MAHKKAGGSSRNGRDSNSQRLGLKIFGGEQCLAGNIIARQRGTKWHPGANVGLAKDHTLFALINGRVEFERALAQTVRWYLDHEAWWRDVTSGAYKAWIDKNYGYRIAV